jgi:hypothetical protein
MNVLRPIVPALVVGGALSLASATVAAYSTPTAPAPCSSSTCQVISVTNGGNRSAQAIFEVNGANLFITLANTSILDVTQPVDVLTALLFNLNYTDGSAVTLSPLSALMAPHSGSNVTFDARTIDANLAGKTCEGAVNVVSGAGCTTSDNVGGEWDYVSGAFTGSFSGFTKGIGSAGLDLFGEADFGGTNLEGPTAVNGGQYGITSAGDNPNTDINGNGYNPVTQNAVQFKLALGTSSKTLDLSASGALSAGFQYGTTQGVPGTFIPIPGTLSLLGLGAFGLCWMRRRRAI